jgi:sterol desaturase/sphingolipid hydroxylase (fatty acid hydroxylase superfamily)
MAMTEVSQTDAAPVAIRSKRRVKLDSVMPFFVVLGVLAVVMTTYWAGVKLFAPQAISIDLFGKHLELSNLHGKLLGGTIMGSWLLLVCIFAAEYLLVGWKDSSARHLAFGRTRSGWSDIGVFLFENLKLNHLILIVFTVGLGLASGTWLHDKVQEWTGVKFGIGDWPVVAQVATCYLVYTFLDYWAHRVQHHRVFWPIHRFHHSAEDFYILTAGRVHPADLSSAFMLMVPLLFLGPTPEAMLAIYTITGIVRFMVHSRIPSNYGWIGRWVVQSPMDHRMHHILDMSQGQGGHYSLFPLWDQMFGTWRGGGHPELAIGVFDKPYRHGVWVLPDMARDYWHFIKEVLATVGFGRKTPEYETMVPQQPLSQPPLVAANDALPVPPNDPTPLEGRHGVR